MRPFVEVTFHRGRPMAAYVRLAARPVDVVRTDEAARGIVVDRGADGGALGIEILEFDTEMVTRLNAVLTSIGHDPLSNEELAPLHAA